ncbi:hypothetical protein PI125_g17484 [Phytophthora idaei]|nr:hypothetical protein PI125_g17484 [Phytophthora idaei]KAG3140098.1 hypothetical protein PI126_g16178 [Phytophthora idaei]
MKGYDAFKIVQGEETASACTVRVLKPLDCAHKVAMECSQWKQSPGAMQRVSKLRTVHPRNGMAGHSFFLRLCSSTTRLETVIKGTQRVLSDKSLTLYVVEYSQQAGLSRSEAEVAGTIQRRHRFELKTRNEENVLGVRWLREGARRVRPPLLGEVPDQPSGHSNQQREEEHGEHSRLGDASNLHVDMMHSIEIRKEGGSWIV